MSAEGGVDRHVAELLLSASLFSLMALLTRTLAGHLSTGQVVAFRFAVGLAGVGAVFVGHRSWPKTDRLGLWTLRGAIGGLSVCCYFYAIETVGVGAATLLNYASPCYAAVFAAVFLRERLTLRTVAGLTLATVGAAMVGLGSGAGSGRLTLSLGALAGMASAAFSGAAMTTVRALRKTTDSSTVFLSFCIFGLALGLPLSVADWKPITWDAGLRAFGVGALSFVAQMLFTHAFGFVSATVGAATLQVTPVLTWALGVVLMGEPFGPLTAAGAALSLAAVGWTAAGRRVETGAR